MKEKKRLIGATIKNTPSHALSKFEWFEQKKYTNKLHYALVYEKLDDLSQKGYTCLQIEEILNLGEEAYKNKNL